MTVFDSLESPDASASGLLHMYCCQSIGWRGWEAPYLRHSRQEMAAEIVNKL